MAGARGRILLVAAVLVGLVAVMAWRPATRVMNRIQTSIALSRTVDPDSPLEDQCDVPAGPVARATFTGADDTPLGGAVVGDPSPTAVLLRYGGSQTICDWLPWAEDMHEATGAQVVLFDRRGRGATPGRADLAAEVKDTRLVVGQLRSDGADSIVLVASSMGNAIMFAAVEGISPAVCAVAAISPVLSAGDVDGSALRGLPHHVAVTWEARRASIDGVARHVLDRAGEQGAVTVATPVDTTRHSRQLILHHPEAAAAVVAAVDTCIGRGE